MSFVREFNTYNSFRTPADSNVLPFTPSYENHSPTSAAHQFLKTLNQSVKFYSYEESNPTDGDLDTTQTTDGDTTQNSTEDLRDNALNIVLRDNALNTVLSSSRISESVKKSHLLMVPVIKSRLNTSVLNADQLLSSSEILAAAISKSHNILCHCFSTTFK